VGIKEAPSQPPPSGEELQGDKIQMKNILETYTSYNLWANTKLLDVVKGLDISLLDKEIKSSFSSLRKTAHHIWFAEEIWHIRLHGNSPASLPEPDNDFPAFVKQLLARSQGFIDLVKARDENYFTQSCSYKAVNRDSYTNPHWEMIMHCMNHSTYHRGQIVTILREVGETTIPSTDLIAYLREIK
jgi:uncharacterized damage-inducible protein DinB